MQFGNFDLNLLRTLDALLVEKSVTRAAERLCISQPAMSGALQRLRDYFKDQLLIRMGRDMELTPLAESLASPVRAALLQIQATLATRPNFDPSVARRQFHVAMSDYASLVLMPPVLRRLAAEAPYMTCHVEMLTDASFSRVETGDLDFFATVENWHLFRRDGMALELKMRRLFADDFVCVVDSSHPTIGERLTIEQYRTLPHISVRFGHRLITLVEQAWKLAELDINVAATGPSFSALLFMLRGTNMIATVQRRFAATLAATLPLRVLECPFPVEPLQEILMWHARSEFDPGHQYLRQVFLEAAKAL
jgi:LysR family nod box-dependent transcriptional activator